MAAPPAWGRARAPRLRKQRASPTRFAPALRPLLARLPACPAPGGSARPGGRAWGEGWESGWAERGWAEPRGRPAGPARACARAELRAPRPRPPRVPPGPHPVPAGLWRVYATLQAGPLRRSLPEGPLPGLRPHPPLPQLRAVQAGAAPAPGAQQGLRGRALLPQPAGHPHGRAFLCGGGDALPRLVGADPRSPVGGGACAPALSPSPLCTSHQGHGGLPRKTVGGDSYFIKMKR